VDLPAAVVRSAPLDLCGSAFHEPIENGAVAYRKRAEHVAAGNVTVDLERLPLREVATAWERQRKGAGPKLVLIR
jgi:hypothetical protein